MAQLVDASGVVVFEGEIVDDGSQPQVERLSIDFSDLPDDEDTIVLRTLAAGSVVVALSWDPSTWVKWNSGDADTTQLQVGNPPIGSLNGGDFTGWFEIAPTDDISTSDGPDSVFMALSSRSIAGVATPASMVYSPAETLITARYLSSAPPASAGHLDVLIVVLALLS